MRLHSTTTLRALMTQRSYSYGRLARYAGCSRGFISHLVTGRRKTCSPQLAARIAEALDVPLELLFGMSVERVKRVPAREKVA